MKLVMKQKLLKMIVAKIHRSKDEVRQVIPKKKNPKRVLKEFSIIGLCVINFCIEMISK